MIKRFFRGGLRWLFSQDKTTIVVICCLFALIIVVVLSVYGATTAVIGGPSTEWAKPITQLQVGELFALVIIHAILS